MAEERFSKNKRPNETGRTQRHAGGRTAGRPRDEAAGPNILEVTRRLVGERGYEAVTTRDIATASGSAKQTIYRRWPTKADLVLEAFLSHAEEQVDVPRRRTGPLRVQIADYLRRTFAALAESGPAMKGLMAAAQRDEAFRASFRARFIEPRRRALSNLLAGEGSGSRKQTDAETATMMLYGAMWYRLLLDEPLDSHYADRLAAVAVAGLRPARARVRRR